MNDVNYYMSEACPYLAIALHRKFGYQLLIIKGDNGKSYPHVFVASNKSGFGIDAKGERPIKEIVDYYWDVDNKQVLKISEKDLIKNYMGDDRPFFDYSDKEISEAYDFIDLHLKVK
jgi:hypothetical protein